MDIGKLNRRVEILTYEVTRDDFGGEDGVWVPTKYLWANIDSSNGTEFYNNQKVNAESTTIITIRYNTKIDVMNRIKYLDKIYEIIGIIDEGTKHKVMRFNCKELVSDGLQRKTEES